MKEFFKERSKIEKLLEHYKGLRSAKKKDSSEESIEQMKKIKVLGEKTIYFEKKEPVKKK